MEKWKPINFNGRWSYDPKDELKHRARIAMDQGDGFVAIPVKLAIACADFRECRSTTRLTGDEDGPFKEPITIVCTKSMDHPDHEPHGNGYISWR